MKSQTPSRISAATNNNARSTLSANVHMYNVHRTYIYNAAALSRTCKSTRSANLFNKKERNMYFIIACRRTSIANRNGDFSRGCKKKCHIRIRYTLRCVQPILLGKYFSDLCAHCERKVFWCILLRKGNNNSSNDKL